MPLPSVRAIEIVSFQDWSAIDQRNLGEASYDVSADGAVSAKPYTFAEPLEVVIPTTPGGARPDRLVAGDVARDEWRLEYVPPEAGTRVHPDGLEVTQEALQTGTISADAPSPPAPAPTEPSAPPPGHRPGRLHHHELDPHLRRAHVHRDGRNDLYGGPGGALAPHLGETLPAMLG
ncbi:hypothetical protein [Streptomyces sp. NPDC056525]|uniref:hypothetical protein n=1 Tax=unclassified Streptomyces TaxID=2593676 RepID=UPI00368649D2